MSYRALFFAGGWPRHQPEAMAQRLSQALEPYGFETEITGSLDVLADADALSGYSLISPFWTAGSLSPEQSAGLLRAVSEHGVGFGGVHGGMGDAFRGNLDYEWAVGGHFVGHPHVGDYEVRVMDPGHPICDGLPVTFPYRSEQYYMMVDPGIQVLADADYHHAGQVVRMPIAWTKQWGKGRVFYSALGHEPEEFDRHPASLRLAVQGLLWAARAL